MRSVMDRAGPTDYDAELRRHNEVLRRACVVQPGEHVLDIGCGSGQTTCEAARLARGGSALGVDISASAALDWVRGFACTKNVLDRLDPAATARTGAPARDARRARERQRCLVRLPRLDRHRPPRLNRDMSDDQVLTGGRPRT